MAKVSFNKLGLKNLNNIKEIEINNNKIEVKQYLPINEKLNLISEVLIANESDNPVNFYNPLKIKTLIELYIIFYYTNINFTDKQKKENLDKLYDLLSENKIIESVFSSIPTDELDCIYYNTKQTIESFIEYKNSTAGILESLQKNSNNLSNEINELLKDIKENDDLNFLQEVMDKLG